MGYSVTQRIRMVQQPKGGYLPPKYFNEIQFWDAEEILEVTSGVKSIQGMAVDYLTRFMLGQSKEQAFEISLMGAQLVGDEGKSIDYLRNINGLDDFSIICACNLVGYDAAFRRDVTAFAPIDQKCVSANLISNIRTMVTRSLKFLKKYGPVTMCGFTMDGGYNDIISMGDGDYLTENMLIDFKTSAESLNSKQTLQLAIYYIMGVHSIYRKFQNIEKLCAYNPLLNKAYLLDIEDIDNSVLVEICRDVVGYHFTKENEDWKSASGTDKTVLQRCVEHGFTDFSPDNYADGVHEISFDDYWSYSFIILNLSLFRPSFSRSEKILMLKNSGFYMFVSVSHSQKSISIMHGGQLKKLSKPLQYYYDRLPEYGTYMLNAFSKYWDNLYKLSHFIKSIMLSATDATRMRLVEQKENSLAENNSFGSQLYKTKFSGRAHGCIVDLDFNNHLFLNPFDGTITPYYALSTEDKIIYKSVESLIANKRPEMLEEYRKKLNLLENKRYIELTCMIAQNSLTAQIPRYRIEPVENGKESYICTDTYMYYLSDFFKRIQPIYDHHVVTVWHDEFLPMSEKEYRFRDPEAITGQFAQMKCGMVATVISDNGARDICVEFEDGTVVEHTTRLRFRNRTISNPDLENAKTVSVKKSSRKRQSYVGQTKEMLYGHSATVIEDFGCNDITVQFEDGLIRKHCKRSKFREGKIAHKIDEI